MKRQWKDYQIIIIGIFAYGLIGLCDGSVPNCEHELNGVMYPNTLDCSTFWVCEYDRPTLVQCNGGLLYDPQLKVCNWWYDVECGETPIGTTTQKPTTSSVENTETSVWETTEAPEPGTTEILEPNTTESSQTTEAPVSETTEAHPTTSETTSVTKTTTSPSTYPNCENRNGQIYYPHLTDSSKYYICVGTLPIEFQCPSKFLWNQEHISCLSTDISEETCSKDEYTSHPENEQYYYQCIDGKPVLSLCPSNLKWNQNLLKCADESSVHPQYPNCNNTNGQIYFPHLTEISKYYFCAGNYPVELPCPSKFQWYQTYERCIGTDISESEEEFIDCSTEKYARHPAEEQMYYECVDNKPIIIVCPSDLKWNQELLDCIEETHYPQCHNPTGQIYFAHLTDLVKYYICVGDLAIGLSCPDTFFWYQEYQTCARTELPEGEEGIIDCTSNEQEYAAHSQDEQIYYRCIDKNPIQMLCPGNLRWDQNSLNCTNAVPIPKYPQCENINGQIYFPHLKDPTKYYICAGNFAVELTCPTNFMWNQDYESCVRTEPPVDEEEPLDCELEDGPQFAPHLENDQLYYHCIGENPIQMLCPSILKWNQELLKCTNELSKYPQCDNPNGQIYFTHLTDSRKYYICIGDFGVELTCPSGFLWEQEYESCARTENSEEEIKVIDCLLEGGPQSAPHEDEQFYYLCVAEKPVLLMCPSDLKWDSVLEKCSDNVTPQPTYPQCNNPSGQIYFPHLTNPISYYICAGDFAIELQCPSGFLWSQDYQSCAATETPAEEEGIIDCSSESGPQSAPYEVDNQFYYLCVAKQPILMLCPSDLKWDQVQQICTDELIEQPDYPQCNNPSGQIYFPHLNDPSKYYICAGYFAVELPCPSGFLWNQNYQSCASINKPGDEETGLDCLLENGTQSAAHANNDQLYYLCIAEQPVLLFCPSDLKWDNHLEACIDTNIIEPEYPKCDNSDGQKYFSHLTDVNKYYICAGTIPIELLCPSKYIWNQGYKSCLAEETWEEEYPLVCDKTDNFEHMPHPTDSQKYFICVDHRPALMHCPANGTWDDVVSKCLLEIVVEPNYPPCGTGQILYPHLTDPTKYYLCSGEYAVIMTCQNNYIWDTDDNKCVENIPVTEEPDCAKTNGKTNIPHPSNPHKYYICVGTLALEMDCPRESLWNDITDSCSVEDPQPIYPDCGGEQMLFPHLTDAEKYYMCIGGQPYTMSCVDDYIWDAEFNTCSSNTKLTTTESTIDTTTNNAPEIICTEPSTFVPHPTDVTKYYACVGSPPISILFSCTGNTFWRTTLQRCDVPEMVNLPNMPSLVYPEPDCSNGAEFLTNYQNCHKYYICVGGILPMEFTCEEDKYWNAIITRCDDDSSNCSIK